MLRYYEAAHVQTSVMLTTMDPYFQCPIQSAFLPYIDRQAVPALRRIGFNTQYRTSDVAENLGRYLSCTERTFQWKDFKLILTVKMETRHPVERVSLVVNFRRSVIIV